MRGARVHIFFTLPVAASLGFMCVSSPARAWGSVDAVATLAHADLRAPAACRASMHAGVAVVVCGQRRRSLPILGERDRRRARGFPRARPVRGLAGAPLMAGEQVTVRRRYSSARTELIAVAAIANTYGYVRYRLPRRAHLSATLRVSDRGGRPTLTLTVGGRRESPQVERWTALNVPTLAPAIASYMGSKSNVTGPTTFRECGTIAPVDARDAAGFDRLWHLERNGPGWTGGDATISVRLGDGRVAWLFGDSFIGGVLPDGRRSPASHMVRNAIVVQDGACLITAVGGSAQAPIALVQPIAPDEWYWPEQATAEGHVLHAVMLRVVRTGPTGWDFAVTGEDVVDLDLSSFTVTARRPLPTDGTVLWGASILQLDDATYVYGIENKPIDARVFLARAGGPTLAGDWEFYSGDRNGPSWSREPHDVAPLPAAPTDGDDPDQSTPLTGVSSSISVVSTPPDVMLISQAPVFGTAVTLRRAPAPWGPFSAPEVIATAAPPSIPEAFTYGALLQPELAAGDLQLLSWNVNTFGDVMADATIYRPRFAALAWPPAPDQDSPRAKGHEK
jgi:hypothetical protein